jgi:hypothetical protein
VAAPRSRRRRGLHRASRWRSTAGMPAAWRARPRPAASSCGATCARSPGCWPGRRLPRAAALRRRAGAGLAGRALLATTDASRAARAGAPSGCSCSPRARGPASPATRAAWRSPRRRSATSIAGTSPRARCCARSPASSARPAGGAAARRDADGGVGRRPAAHRTRCSAVVPPRGGGRRRRQVGPDADPPGAAPRLALSGPADAGRRLSARQRRGRGAARGAAPSRRQLPRAALAQLLVARALPRRSPGTWRRPPRRVLVDERCSRPARRRSLARARGGERLHEREGSSSPARSPRSRTRGATPGCCCSTCSACERLGWDVLFLDRLTARHLPRRQRARLPVGGSPHLRYFAAGDRAFRAPRRPRAARRRTASCSTGASGALSTTSCARPSC